MKTASAQPTRWKCVCSYDGTRFTGWQSQASGDAIQDVIERSLAKVLKTDTRVHGSGRTDAGVHARAQVFHFDAVWPHGAEKLRRAMQTGLPRTIQLQSLRPAPADFHARFAARGKIYHYEIFLGEPDPFTLPYCWAIGWEMDWAAVEAAAALLRGKHDFKAFSAEGGTERETTVRHLRRLEIRRRGRRVRFVFEADGFLYKMVRSLTGALVHVGLGKLAVADVGRMLRDAKRVARVQTAPPQGLFLVRVFY
ncbi:MAG: tRNA pseudouridine(38-40) synthase TruA [Candidatus Didemnitutus sp.]|nr:tRNA pseudouridine(38-40) synthase TruA [Candidatus Didemnitutus sp.]